MSRGLCLRCKMSPVRCSHISCRDVEQRRPRAVRLSQPGVSPKGWLGSHSDRAQREGASSGKAFLTVCLRSEGLLFGKDWAQGLPRRPFPSPLMHCPPGCCQVGDEKQRILFTVSMWSCLYSVGKFQKYIHLQLYMQNAGVRLAVKRLQCLSEQTPIS